MSFATLQQRVNTTALKRLGAGSAITLGGLAVSGDFLQPSDQVYLDGVSAVSNVPTLTMLSSAVPGNVMSLLVVADSATYSVGEAKPDGFGFTVLHLEPVL